jgi:DNA (cytosine-5)-methyltransferase 1
MYKAMKNNVGAIIRKLREDRHLSLNTVAIALNIDTSLLSKIERSERNATKDQILKLCETFRVETKYLLIPYLSEIVCEGIGSEDCAEEVLKLSENKIKTMHNISKKSKLKVLDLFSGCGGFSYGFEAAGYHVVLGVDNNEVALQTFRANHKNSKTLCGDLHDDEVIEKIVNSIAEEQIDVIIAGPPCQGFSLTGARNEEDDRNKLFYAVFKLAKRIKPRAVIIENVPGLAALYGGQAKKSIEEQFKNLNFSVNYKVLYAPDYEVPQIRKRIFFVGLADNTQKFEFPSPVLTPSDYNTCSVAISDLPSRTMEFGSECDSYDTEPFTEYQKRMRNGTQVLYNHVSSKHSEMVVNVISQVPEGGNHKDLPPGIGDSRKFNEAWTRYHSGKPSKTIDTGHRNHFHYKHNRIPTVRENARLQSFPDSFVFSGNRTQQYKQVGNAVPPLLGFHVARKLAEYLIK